MKSHLQSYPCPLIINYFWNLGFLLVSYNIFLLPVLESKFILYRDYLHYEPVYVEWE